MRDDAAGLSFLGSMYAIGAVLIGVILIADNLILLVRNGNLESEPEGKAVGLTAVFMGMEATWLMVSLVVLWSGAPRPLLPTLYLIFAAVTLIFGALKNQVNGPVRSLPIWHIKSALLFSFAFTPLRAQRGAAKREP